MPSPGGGPLAGLRVVDLTHALAGPYCTMVLADLGADVVKVEPLHGDGTRVMGPFLPDDELRAFGGYFQSVNRNKRSIAIDLKAAEGREILAKLIAGADVVVENFRTGVLERLGFAYDDLHAKHPKLVYACIRGFGDSHTGDQAKPESPYSQWPAFDVVAQAMGGLTAVTGPDAGHPMNAGAPVGDLAPAMFAALGIMSAAWHAQRTGQGQMVDVAMYDAVLAFCERIVYLQSYSGETAGPVGASNPQLCPFDSFPTSDGWITIAAPGPRHWQLLCDLMGKHELGEDQRYSTNADRVARAPEVRRLIIDWTSTMTKHQVMDLIGGLVPCGPVNTVIDIFEDPHVARREMIVRVDHPGSARRPEIAGTPIKLTETPSGVRHRAPLLGEHADEVLKEAGYEQHAISELRNGGVIR